MRTPKFDEVLTLWTADGSLRDIYWFNTWLVDWERLLDLVQDYPITYKRNGEPRPLPSAAEIFADLQAAHFLSIKVLEQVTVNCSYIRPDEMELDVDPREIQSQTEHAAVLAFVERVSISLGKCAHITGEMDAARPRLIFNPQGRFWMGATMPCEVADFAAVIQPLIGLPVSRSWAGYGSAIFLELGRLAPPDDGDPALLEGEAGIGLEWDWRVENDTSVLYGSGNWREEIERGIETLTGSIVQGIAVTGEVAELVITFSNGLRLRSMVMVTGDPQWTIRLPEIVTEAKCLYVSNGGLLMGKGQPTDLSDQEEAAFALAERTAARWGIPVAEPKPGHCADCAWYVRLNGEADLLGYGACIESASPFDGRIVHVRSGCPCYLDREAS